MNRVHPEDDEDLLRELSADPGRTLGVLYERHKQTFLGVMRRIGGSPDLHKEVYHDTILAFYDIWTDGRYDPTRASVSTLLCAIGKNKLLTRLGKERRNVEWTELTLVEDRADDLPQTNEHMIRAVEGALSTLGEGCREIITLFYYHRSSIRQIAERLNYKNENVVKAHKSRCIKRLKEILQSTGP